MYHLNILKPWREVFPVVLVMVVPQRDNLGLEVCLKIQLNPQVPCEDQVSLSQWETAQLEMEFSNVFSPDHSILI